MSRLLLFLSEVREMKALKVEKFESTLVSDDGEMRIALGGRDGLLPVKYIKDIFADDEHYYIVPHEHYQNDKCFQEIYRDFLVDLPAKKMNAMRKMVWIVVDYDLARCRNCLTTYRATKVETELHGTQYVFLECPRCHSDEYDLTTESYLEVYEQ
jgi:Zn finger protein HypA/HybF involved in hydrogenase expression